MSFISYSPSNEQVTSKGQLQSSRERLNFPTEDSPPRNMSSSSASQDILHIS